MNDNIILFYLNLIESILVLFLLYFLRGWTTIVNDNLITNAFLLSIVGFVVVSTALGGLLGFLTERFFQVSSCPCWVG